MSRVLRQVLLLVGLLCLQGLAAAQVSRDVAEEMVRKSGLWESLGSVAQQVRGSIANSASQRGSPLGAMDLEQLGRAAESAYAPAKLRTTTVTAVARVMTPSQLAELRAWFDSPRGKTITAAEEAMAASTRSPDELVREGQRAYAEATAERRAIIERISDATRAPEALANLTINTAVAIHQGVIRAQGLQAAPSVAELRSALVTQKPQMMQMFAGIVLSSSTLAYASIGDPDLDAYASFLESKPGTRFTGQCLLAFDQALSQAGREIGQSLPSSRPKATT